MTARRTGERGAALLTTMVAVAVLTAVAVDLAYSSRVSLQIAANARDELRAGWLARSGVSLARLVLSFQQQLDDLTPAGGAVGAGIPRVQLWNLVPVDSTLTAGLFPSAASAEDAARGTSFDARVEDEGRKVNAQLEGLAQTGDRKLWAQVQALYQLVCDPRWDPLFDREDARGVRSTREDLLVRLRDWVDEDERSSELVVAGGTGATCGMVPGQPPFVAAYGDENQPYDRGDDRYRAKNARMDSLDELYLVAGVGDAFMAAFGDALTVYVPRDAKRNVNVQDARTLVELARLVADPPTQPVLLDPALGERLQKLVRDRTLGGILSFTPQDLGTFVEAAGVHVNASLLSTASANSTFTDRSTTFRIRASGKAGAVRSSIDAVLRLEKPQTPEPVPVPGRIIHWREE